MQSFKKNQSHLLRVNGRYADAPKLAFALDEDSFFAVFDLPVKGPTRGQPNLFVASEAVKVN